MPPQQRQKWCKRSPLKLCFTILLTFTFLSGILMGITLMTSTTTSRETAKTNSFRSQEKPSSVLVANIGNITASKSKDATVIATNNKTQPNYNVHGFYYPWYGSPQFDGQYYHWNHRYLPQWDKKDTRVWPTGRHMPPDDIGANFYPKLGPYSSDDPAVIEDHMKQVRKSGIGVLAVSWYPSNMSDDAGRDDMSDALIPVLLEAAKNHDIKICLHIEPYKGRDHETIRRDLNYVIKKYGSHPAFYRRVINGKTLPLYYIYDSYLVPSSNWAKIFKPDGEMTVRNTDLDGIFIGLVVEPNHREEVLVKSGFDGYYTYFASDTFSFGSRYRNWQALKDYAKAHNSLFIPSVGPGYIDERIRPWNGRYTKQRKDGEYYDRSWQAALNVRPAVISVTSFNEWHEGTQIEAAVPKSTSGFKYLDYTPHDPDYYLSETRKMVDRYQSIMKFV